MSVHSSDFEEDILVSLEILAEQRKETIAKVSATRKYINRNHRDGLQQLARKHRAANKVLVEGIDAAHQRGIPKNRIYKQIGMSAQRVAQLRHALNDHKGGC